MNHFAFYDVATGAIVGTFCGTEEDAELNAMGRPYKPCDPDVSDATHRVDAEGNIVGLRPLQCRHTANGLVLRIEGLPAGCRVDVMGKRFVADAHRTEIEFPEPGVFPVVLSANGYCETRLEAVIGG